MLQRWIDDFKAGASARMQLTELRLWAIGALIVALLFLCAAGFIAIEETYGPVEACLAGAALFVVIALGVIAVRSEFKRREEARRAEAAKRAAQQSLLTDPALLATGLQLVRVIGVKRLLPVVVLGGVALGLMAARGAARDTPDTPEPPAE